MAVSRQPICANLDPMDLDERLRRAQGSVEELASVLFDHSEEVLLALLDNPRLTEEHVKVLLSRKGLGRNILAEIAARARLLRAYAVKLGLARHPHSPRHVSLVLLRYLYPFDLVRVAATPAAGAELRRAAEEAIVARLPMFSLGERLTLARQGSARVAAGLLSDSEDQVIRTVLDNPRLTEEGVVRALREQDIGPQAARAVAAHPRWSSRYEVRLALIRNPATSFRCVLELVQQVRRRDLAELTADRMMPADRRAYLARLVERRPGRSKRALAQGSG
jgi:hypothetical protein